jgi:lipopolysaccharide transport system ATP-binding protein
MSDLSIRVQQLGKQYRIGGPRARYRTIRETVMQAMHAPIRRVAGLLRGEASSAIDLETSFWALRDVSFEVKQGDVVGIIGRNGAGKSTLLKILSRITEPTEGYADLYGRIGSLLEVGTGFHPELTGRENIYLNGAILGMRRTEIDKKFDEIVDFAEIEKFLDTPVKFYSSGMYVRLAFSVAAHLEPEILLVDEVLAVGDAQFQKKCLGKMGDVAREGRTVLFVSHNMSAVISLCRRGLLLVNGSLKMDDEISRVVSEYTSNSELNGLYQAKTKRKKLTIEQACLLRNNEVSTSFYNSEILTLQIECTISERIVGAQVAFELLTDLGECIFSSTNQDYSQVKGDLSPGRYIFQCPIDLSMLRPKRYLISLSSSIPNVEILDAADLPLSFELFDDSSPILKLGQGRRGVILPILQWTMSKE